MARLDEIAEGLAEVVAGGPLPDPLFIDMAGYAAIEVTFFIRALVNVCERRGSPLSHIRVCADLGADAAKVFGPEPLTCGDVSVELAPSLDQRIAIHRFPMERPIAAGATTDQASI